MQDYVFNMAKGKVMKQTNGLYPAPLKILEAVRAGLDGGPDAGYKAEREKFGGTRLRPWLLDKLRWK